MEPIVALFCQNLVTFRKSLGFSQEVLAEKAHLASTHLSQIENGHRWPKPKTISSLASALSVSVTDLFTQKEGVSEPDLMASWKRVTRELGIAVDDKAIRRIPVPAISASRSIALARLSALDDSQIERLLLLIERNPNIARQVDSLVSKDKEQKRYKRETK